LPIDKLNPSFAGSEINQTPSSGINSHQSAQLTCINPKRNSNGNTFEFGGEILYRFLVPSSEENWNWVLDFFSPLFSIYFVFLFLFWIF